MAFPYRQVLLIGATAGIGAAMADRLVSEGIKVIAVGRRQDRLDAFVQKHGKDMAGAVRFDVSDQANLDHFVSGVTESFPDLDSVFLNAGFSRPTDLADPDKTDLASFHDQFSVNFTSLVNVTLKFLPFLLAKKTQTSIIFTGSNVAIIPAWTLPAYSASKAALNVFTLCLREQLRNTSVRVLELSPPPVQTEIHDYLGQEKGRHFGMPVDEYIDVAFKGLASGSDQIVTGAIGPAEVFNRVIDDRRTAFENLAKMMRGETA